MLGLGNLGRMVFGSANDRRVKRYQPTRRGDQRPRARDCGAERRRAQGQDRRVPPEARRRAQTLDDLLAQAFATVREAAKRTLGQRHFDVQLVGGMVLNEGSIAEMKTGEGKTLVATLPVYLNALAGKRRARRHRQRLPRPPRRGMDGPHLPVPRAFASASSCTASIPDAAPAGLRRRRDLRHQQRVRLRLSARQHGVQPAEHGAARALSTRSSTRWTPSWSTRRARRSSSPARPRTAPSSTSPSTSSSRSSAASDFELDEKVRSANFTEDGTEKVEGMLAAADMLQGRRRSTTSRTSPSCTT